jgi:hypothetical protein
VKPFPPDPLLHGRVQNLKRLPASALFVIVLCLHLAPDTTQEALHSRPVMALWELIHKGM